MNRCGISLSDRPSDVPRVLKVDPNWAYRPVSGTNCQPANANVLATVINFQKPLAQATVEFHDKCELFVFEILFTWFVDKIPHELIVASLESTEQER